MNVLNKKITIIGCERSGMAAARLAKSHGGIPQISEKKSADQIEASAKDWIQNNKVSAEFGGHTREFILESDCVVISPGVLFQSPAVQWAKEAGIAVLGEIEFAFQFCDKPVVAVTGSNGKTTVTTLIHQIIETAGHRCALCGNVGSPFSSHADEFNSLDYAALEVSSFQMESLLTKDEQKKFGLKGFRPHAAVIINISQNHLDRHADMNEYIRAKARILENQTPSDFLVLNNANEILKTLAPSAKSQVRWFDGKAANPNHEAATAVGNILGIPEAICRKVFAEFKGVEHRMELARCVDGVEFYNDSKATTPEAASWALQRFSEPVVLICGGRDKKVDFTLMRDLVRQKVKIAIVIGEAREKIRKAFDGCVPVVECEDLKSAVETAWHQAARGDHVILSPMCASFDMFKDYEHRGKVFKQIVNQLKVRSAECVEKLRTTHHEPRTF